MNMKTAKVRGATSWPVVVIVKLLTRQQIGEGDSPYKEIHIFFEIVFFENLVLKGFKIQRYLLHFSNCTSSQYSLM